MARPSSAPGFSLIELLVTVTITLVLIGGALAAFTRYSDRQAVTSAVEELKVAFQSAQTKAAAGDLGGCDRLAGYRVQTYLVGNETQISLQAVCATGEPSPAKIQSLSPAVTVSPSLDIVFQVLNAGAILADDAATQDIVVQQSEHTYLFTLSREGRVNEGTWQ